MPLEDIRNNHYEYKPEIKQEQKQTDHEAEFAQVKERLLTSLNTIPDDLLCPINQELLISHRMTPQGKCYDEKMITNWVNLHRRCPETQAPLQPNDLVEHKPITDLLNTYRTAYMKMKDAATAMTMRTQDGVMMQYVQFKKYENTCALK